MSRGHSLICFDCHIRRNKFGMQITKSDKIVGHVCIKCSQKREVMGRPSGVGWRTAWQGFVHELLKARQKIAEQMKTKPVMGRAV